MERVHSPEHALDSTRHVGLAVSRQVAASGQFGSDLAQRHAGKASKPACAVRKVATGGTVLIPREGEHDRTKNSKIGLEFTRSRF
jgi:hypothetical protein